MPASLTWKKLPVKYNNDGIIRRLKTTRLEAFFQDSVITLAYTEFDNKEIDNIVNVALRRNKLKKGTLSVMYKADTLETAKEMALTELEKAAVKKIRSHQTTLKKAYSILGLLTDHLPDGTVVKIDGTDSCTLNGQTGTVCGMTEKGQYLIDRGISKRVAVKREHLTILQYKI